MALTRSSLDLSKINIHQVISNQEEEERRMAQSNTSNQNGIIDESQNINSSCQPIKSDSPIIKIGSPPSTHLDTTETKTAAFPQLDNRTNTVPHTQSSSHFTDNSEDKELARIPYYNGKTNIYAWLIAIKSVFTDLKYDENTWVNKAKYYLLDEAAQFVYFNDHEMITWNTFRKLMTDQYSFNTTAPDSTHPPTNTLISSSMVSQQHTTYSPDVLAQKAHHALVLEDLKTLPKFSGEDSQSISSWLEEIELVYNKAFITDTDRCSRTLKLLCNADEKWLEFIRRQKLEWNEFKQKLITRFESKKDSSRIQREDDVRNRRYYDNESMHHYYSDVMRKCDLLEEEYPVSDRHRIDYIIRGLPDSIQDQLLIREYSTPKELLEVLQKIEERRKRTNFEQHVFSVEENVVGSQPTPSLRTTFQATKNVQLNTSAQQQPTQYGNMFYNNQSQNYPPAPHYYNVNHPVPAHPASNYNQQHHQQQYRSIQCYNCGKFGHKAVDCFKPKQRLN